MHLGLKIKTHLALIIRHGPPLRSRKDALLRRLSLITKDLLNQFRIRPDTLQEHEVRAQWFLRSVRVLDVSSAGVTSLALLSTERVLALDSFRSKGTLPRLKLELALFLEGFRTTYVGLENSVR